MRNDRSDRRSNVAPPPAGRHSTFDPYLHKLCIVTLVLVCVGAAAHAQPIEGLANIRFVVDVRLFTVMAALNAAGFDYETSPAGMSLVRQHMRAELSAVNPTLREKLKTFYLAHQVKEKDATQPSNYVAFSLWLQNPPRFELSAKPADLPPEVQNLIGFETLLAEFYREADIERLWEKIRPQYVSEIERYRPVIRETMVETLAYLRTPARIALDRQIIFIPDLLGVHGVSHAFNIDNAYYLIVGPAAQPADNREEIRHEYLHFLIDPLISKYVDLLLRHKALQKVAEQRPYFEEKYRDRFSLVVTESLLKAIQFRLPKANDAAFEQRLAEAYDNGLILSYHFIEALKRYEAADTTFNERFPDLLKSIDVAAETGRAARVSEARRAYAKEQAELRNQDQQAEQIREMLLESNKLLQSQEYEKARLKLEEIIKRDPANGSAWFGLGQVESQKRNYEKAIEDYRRAAESTKSSPWIVAWSRLKWGRILADYYNKEEAAVTEFEKILAIQGDVRGADREARKELERIKK
jgi:tetratricopeptide (TPR) repeat protein